MAPNGSRGLESLPVILAAHLSLESSLSSSKIKSFSGFTGNFTGSFTGSLPYKRFGNPQDLYLRFDRYFPKIV